MKFKIILLSVIVVFSFSAIAQKKEIKEAEKVYWTGKPQKAYWWIQQAEKKIENIKGDNLVNFYFLKAMVFSHNKDKNLKVLKENLLTIYTAKKIQDSIKAYKYAKNVKEGIAKLTSKIETIASNAIASKNYNSSANAFYTLYEVNKKDTLSLYNSALSFNTGGQKKQAINKYRQLFKVGYTGIQPEYFATSISSGKSQKIASKADLDELIKRGQYKNPVTKISTSKRVEIIESLAALYLEEGNQKEFENLYQKATNRYPKDKGVKNSKVRIFFNEGVRLAKEKKNTEAITAYKKALKVNPNHSSSNLNIAAILLAKDTDFVNQINASNDNKLRNNLNNQRLDNYKTVIPFLEKYLQAKPNDKSIGNTLLSIYKQTKNPKAAALEAKL